MLDRHEKNRPKSLPMHTNNSLQTQATFQKMFSYATRDEIHATVLAKLDAPYRRCYRDSSTYCRSHARHCTSRSSSSKHGSCSFPFHSPGSPRQLTSRSTALPASTLTSAPKPRTGPTLVLSSGLASLLFLHLMPKDIAGLTTPMAGDGVSKQFSVFFRLSSPSFGSPTKEPQAWGLLEFPSPAACLPPSSSSP